MAFGGHASDEIEHPGHVRASEVDRKEDDLQTLLVRIRRRFDREVDRLLEWPLIRVLNDVLARRYFHDDARHAAVDARFTSSTVHRENAKI
jgi:hypothetical protein